MVIGKETSASLAMAILTILLVGHYVYYNLQEPYGGKKTFESQD